MPDCLALVAKCLAILVRQPTFRMRLVTVGTTSSVNVRALVTMLKDSGVELKALLERARQTMKKYADRKRTPMPDVGHGVGDMVMLSSENIKSAGEKAKWDWKSFGPFKIKEKVGQAGWCSGWSYRIVRRS